jgi:hypothetical protein
VQAPEDRNRRFSRTGFLRQGEDAVTQDSEADSRRDDLPSEAVAAAKRATRLNALIMVLVLVTASFAPPPWNFFAPLLFAISFVYMIVNRVRRALHARRGFQEKGGVPGVAGERPAGEPYSWISRDPKDPRRYKPIG